MGENLVEANGERKAHLSSAGEDSRLSAPSPVLALDLGTKTGWAGRTVSGSVMDRFVFSGVQEFDLRRGESTGMRFIRFRAWLEEMIERGHPKIIAFESVVAFHKSRYSGEVAHGMAAVVQIVAIDHKIETFTVTPSELKKFATGKGNAPKEKVIEAARAKFPTMKIIDDNMADALFILLYTEKSLGIKPYQPNWEPMIR